jgi:hypothetical protein
MPQVTLSALWPRPDASIANHDRDDPHASDDPDDPDDPADPDDADDPYEPVLTARATEPSDRGYPDQLRRRHSSSSRAPSWPMCTDRRSQWPPFGPRPHCLSEREDPGRATRAPTQPPASCDLPAMTIRQARQTSHSDRTPRRCQGSACAGQPPFGLQPPAICRTGVRIVTQVHSCRQTQPRAAREPGVHVPASRAARRRRFDRRRPPQ